MFNSKLQVDWGKLENSPRYKQQEFLAARQFALVPISSLQKNIRKGDHIIFKRRRLGRTFYQHHVLCSDIKNSTTIEAIEYSSHWLRAKLPIKIILFNDIGSIAKIRKKDYTYAYLEMQKAFIVEWRDEFRRYDRHEAVERAKDRGFGQTREDNYGLLTNNCEHFVVWCICGLRVSLQVNIVLHCFIQICCSLLASAKGLLLEGIPAMMRSSCRFSEQTCCYLEEKVCISTTASAALEIITAVYDTVKACRGRKINLIPSHWLLGAKLFKIWVKRSSRLGLGYLGSYIARNHLGPLGGLKIGGINVMIGHLVGEFFGQSLEELADQNTPGWSVKKH